jgi:hypothetical protein
MNRDKDLEIAKRFLELDPKVKPEVIVNHIQRKQKRARPDSFKAIGALATKAVLREK